MTICIIKASMHSGNHDGRLYHVHTMATHSSNQASCMIFEGELSKHLLSDWMSKEFIVGRYDYHA
jgi:hypothetical protein